MSDDIDPIALRDQGIAEAADTCASLWKRLVSNGVPEAYATQITQAYLMAAIQIPEDPDA